MSAMIRMFLRVFNIFGYKITTIDILIVLVGLSLIPLFLDVLNSFVPIGRFVHVYLSRVLVTVLCFLYSTSIYYFFTMVIPYYFCKKDLPIDERVISPLEYSLITFLSLLAIWAWFNTLYCYYKAIYCSPSFKENRDKEEVKVVAEFSENHPRACLNCKIIKEDRMHHCRHCGVCIRNMDHHCIFTGNCVSTGDYGNFVYFFLFIFYTFVGSAYVTFSTALPFWNCFYLSEVSERCTDVGSMSFIFIPGITLFIAMGSFVGVHILLILFGKTTIQAIRWYQEKTKKEKKIDVQAEEKSLEEVTKLGYPFSYLLFPYLIPNHKPKTH